jgi:hypothetical protein
MFSMIVSTVTVYIEIYHKCILVTFIKLDFKEILSQVWTELIQLRTGASGRALSDIVTNIRDIYKIRNVYTRFMIVSF